MRSMLQLTNKPTRALALLFLPVVLVLAYVSISRSSGPPLTPGSKRYELGPNVDLDHDGLPGNVELRSFNDRENFRRRTRKRSNCTTSISSVAIANKGNSAICSFFISRGSRSIRFT